MGVCVIIYSEIHNYLDIGAVRKHRQQERVRIVSKSRKTRRTRKSPIVVRIADYAEDAENTELRGSLLTIHLLRKEIAHA